MLCNEVMDSSRNVKEINDELDDLSVKMLDLMGSYIDIKMSLEDVIKTGSLHLAKSRYIMGNRSVSVLQLPTEDADLLATTRLVLDTDELGFQLEKMTITNGKQENETIGLKHRKNVKDGPQEEEEPQNEKEETRQTKLSQDPLKWFGFLVPQNMRHAQQNFNKALELTVECANLQLEINSVHEKYRKAWARKKQLLGD